MYVPRSRKLLDSPKSMKSGKDILSCVRDFLSGSGAGLAARGVSAPSVWASVDGATETCE